MDVIADDLDVMAVQFGHSLMESDLKQFEDSSNHSKVINKAEDVPDNHTDNSTPVPETETSYHSAQNYDYLPPDIPVIKEESNHYACTDCGMVYTKQSSLSNHRLSKHAFVCENCGSRFGVRANYESHVQFGCGRTAPATKLYECSVCHKMLQSKKTLNKHLKHHYGIGEYRCKVCQRLFQQRTHLDAHMRTHDGQKPFACRLCGNAYSEKSSMTRHLRKTHNTNDTDLIENRIFETFTASKLAAESDSMETNETNNPGNYEYLLENNEKKDDELNDKASYLSFGGHGKIFSKKNDPETSENSAVEISPNSTNKYREENDNSKEDFVDDIPEKLPPGEGDEASGNLSVSSDSDNFSDADEDDETPGIPPSNIEEIILARIKKVQKELNSAFLMKQRGDKHGDIKNFDINKESTYANLPSTNEKALDHQVVNKLLQVPISRDCHICGKVLSSPSALRKHVTRHEDENAYKCVLCKKSFLTTSALQEHMVAHQFEKKIKCDFCKVMFTEKSTYRRHLRRFHDFTLESAREYVHENCKELGPEDYLALMNGTDNDNPVREQTESSEGEEIKTEKQKEQGFFQNNTSTSLSELDNISLDCSNSASLDHLNFHKNIKSETDEVERGMNESGSDHHSKSFGLLPEPKVFDCHICGKLLGTSTSLRRHIKRHGDEFRCTVCKHVFPDSETLHQHMSVHNQQYLICTICGKTMSERSRYRSHLRSVHGFTLEGAQAYADGLLDVGIELKKEIKESENTDDKKTAVNGSDSANLLDSSIENSMEVNEGDNSHADGLRTERMTPEATEGKLKARFNFMFKNYECPICGKELGDASARSKHIRRHDGHVAFECEICSEVFPQIRLIESHVKTHTLRGAKCNVCLLYFADRSSARRHLVKIHGLSPNSNQIEDHMSDCTGDDDFGGNDTSVHYTVIDIKKNPHVKVRDCYNSVLSSAIYQKLYETGRGKSEHSYEKLGRPNSESLINSDNALEKLPDKSTEAKAETEIKQEPAENDPTCNSYINQNSSKLNLSETNKRKSKEQLSEEQKKVKTELEEHHLPLKLVFKREHKETDDENVDSPKFTIKESELISQNTRNNENHGMKSEETDNTADFDNTDCDNEENMVEAEKTCYPIKEENESYLRDTLNKDVALLDEEIRKRLLNVPSMFLPVNQMISDVLSHSADESMVSTETSESFDACDNKRTVNSPRANKHYCFDCRKDFSSYKTYRAHRRRFHPMTCDICNEKFLDLILYQSHMRSHIQSTQAKRYDCPVCGKYIKDASSRAKHLRLHTGEKPYACEICGKRFTQTGHLASHMRLHSGEKPFDCHLCGKYFSEKSSVKRHLRKIHFNLYNKKCKMCGILCVKREDYKEHMLVHTKNIYSCEICKKDFPDSKRLKLHNFNSHDKMNQDARTYACKECDKYFFSTKGLKNHVKRFHTNEIPVYDCALCSRTFLTTLTLESHISTHIKKDLVCLTCNKPFRTNGSLSLHKKRHIISFIQKSEKLAENTKIPNGLEARTKPMSTGNTVLAKEIETANETKVKLEPLDDDDKDTNANDNEKDTNTNRDIMDAKSLTKSKEIERLIEDYVLTITKTSVYTNYSVYRPECILDSSLLEKYLDSSQVETKNQLETDTPKTDPKQIFGNKTNPRSLNVYRCNSCGLFLTTKKHLMRHIIALHKQKSIRCPLCSSKFSTQILLRAHIKRIHDTSNEGRLVCKLCNKELKDQRNLREHMKRHTGNLPYPCTLCSRTFSTHSKLTFHMESHNKVRRQCPKCNTKFVHERSYRLHMQAQCLGRRKRAKFGSQKKNIENYFMNYNCMICGRQYRYQESLQLHLKTDHGGMEMDIDNGGDKSFDIDQCIINSAIKDVENGIAEDSNSSTSHNADSVMKKTFESTNRQEKLSNQNFDETSQELQSD